MWWNKPLKQPQNIDLITSKWRFLTSAVYLQTFGMQANI